MSFKLSAAMPFAQLLGLARAEEGDDEKRSKGAKGEEEDDKEKDAKGRKAKGDKADEEDMEDDEEEKARRAAEEEPDKEDDKDKDASKSKGKKAVDGDDESDDDEKDEPGSKKAIVRQERVRCAQIVAHGFLAGNAEQACVFAFDTNMSAAAAISALNAAGSVGKRNATLKDRMSTASPAHAGAGGGEESPNMAGLSPTAKKIIAAAARAQSR